MIFRKTGTDRKNSRELALDKHFPFVYDRDVVRTDSVIEASSNGRIAVSKTVNEGSNPSAPVNHISLLQAVINRSKHLMLKGFGRFLSIKFNILGLNCQI